MSIKVVHKAVYNREMEPGKRSIPPSGNPDASAAEMPNRSLEADDLRNRLKDNEGWLCVGVQPGSELGEVYVNVQFEGPKGKYDVCMAGQNHVLTTAASWLEEAIGELGGEYDVAIESEPCPKATVPVAIETTARILERRSIEDRRQEQQEQHREAKLAR